MSDRDESYIRSGSRGTGTLVAVLSSQTSSQAALEAPLCCDITAFGGERDFFVVPDRRATIMGLIAARLRAALVPPQDAEVGAPAS